MPRAIVHIGASKCGSSAIQSALSAAPSFTSRTGAKFRYVAIDTEFRALPEHAIVKNALLSRSGYVSSPNPRRFQAATEHDWSTLCNSLRSEIAQGRTLVFSNEAYFVSAGVFTDTHILDRFGVTATILAYVRPQVEYLNSAWWQWGAWTGEAFDAWLQKRLGRAAWARHLAPWRSVLGVRELTVRPLPKDVVADFFESVHDADVPAVVGQRWVNRSLSGTALRVLQRHPNLRPVHRSGIDFLLEKCLPSGKPPWVIDPERADKIINFYREDNLRLLSLMSEDARHIVESDARWWDPAAYADKKVESAGAIDAADRDLDMLAADLISALLSLDGKMRLASR